MTSTWIRTWGTDLSFNYLRTESTLNFSTFVEMKHYDKALMNHFEICSAQFFVHQVLYLLHYFPTWYIFFDYLSYLELALLPCWRFLHDNPENIIQRLVEMTRGIADPLASAYCRLYLVQCSQRVPRHDAGSDSWSPLLMYTMECLYGVPMWIKLNTKKLESQEAWIQRDSNPKSQRLNK